MCTKDTVIGILFFRFSIHHYIDAYRQSMCSIDTCPRQLMQMPLCLDAYMHVARSHHTRKLGADSYPSSIVRWLLSLILMRASGTGMMARRRWLASRVLPTTFCWWSGSRYLGVRVSPLGSRNLARGCFRSASIPPALWSSAVSAPMSNPPPAAAGDLW